MDQFYSSTSSTEYTNGLMDYFYIFNHNIAQYYFINFPLAKIIKGYTINRIEQRNTARCTARYYFNNTGANHGMRMGKWFSIGGCSTHLWSQLQWHRKTSSPKKEQGHRWQPFGWLSCRRNVDRPYGYDGEHIVSIWQPLLTCGSQLITTHPCGT